MEEAAPSGDDTAPDGVDAVPAVIPPRPPPPPRPWGDDHYWRPTELDARSVDVEVLSDGSLFALAANGAVYRSRDGVTWRVSLSGTDEVEEADEEDLILEAETSLIDLTEAEDGDIDSDQAAAEAAEDDGEEVEDVDTTEELQGLDDVDLAVVDAADRTRILEGGQGRLWRDSTRSQTVFAGRADGLWVTRDGGRRWTRAASMSGARTFLPLSNTELLVGADDGLWISRDGGRRFTRLLPGLGELVVHDLEQDGQVILAATDDGLWLSVGGERWARTPSSIGLTITDVLLDPTWDGGMWLATEDGLLRSDDLGQSMRAASRNRLRGSLRLLALGTPGRLMVAGEDGAWESVDGGTTWQPLNLGLDDPLVLGLRLDGATPVIAGAQGVLRLGRAPEEADREDAEAALRIPPLGDVITRALGRPGLEIDAFNVSGRLIAARFLPELRLGLRHDDEFNRKADLDPDNPETTEDTDKDWIWSVRLCWGLCAGSLGVVTSSSYDSSSSYADYGVVGGEVYDFSSDAAVPAAAANVSQRGMEYRNSVADIVTKAWFVRRQLAIEAASVRNLPLQDQLTHHLRVEEVEARLDLYTDGWYARAAHGLDEP